MEDTPYNKRELDHFLGEMKEQLDRIEVQTRLTNGRTTKNELSIATVNTKINTAIWAFGVTVPIIISLGGILFYTKIQAIRDAIPSEVSEAVYKALDDYQFQVINPIIENNDK